MKVSGMGAPEDQCARPKQVRVIPVLELIIHSGAKYNNQVSEHNQNEGELIDYRESYQLIVL